MKYSISVYNKKVFSNHYIVATAFFIASIDAYSNSLRCCGEANEEESLVATDQVERGILVEVKTDLYIFVSSSDFVSGNVKFSHHPVERIFTSNQIFFTLVVLPPSVQRVAGSISAA